MQCERRTVDDYSGEDGRRPLFRPERLCPAYVEVGLDEIEGLIRDQSPYPNLAGLKGYEGFDLPPTPWFRQKWADDGVLKVKAAEPLLYNEQMIGAARRVFQAEIIRPCEVVVNLMGPMPGGGAHVDSPSFRGLMHTGTPTWLLQLMGASRLFEPWAIRVAGAVSWIYHHTDGGYEYWPDGRGSRSSRETGPFGNVAVVGDNDYMFHQVESFGAPDRYAAATKCTRTSTTVFVNGGWDIVDEDAVVARYEGSEMRISLLWRAYTFRDPKEAAIFDDQENDLTLGHVVNIFQQDLAARGLRTPDPTDPSTDDDWIRELRQVYGWTPAG
jgi:hypothetical protein